MILVFLLLFQFLKVDDVVMWNTLKNEELYNNQYGAITSCDSHILTITELSIWMYQSIDTIESDFWFSFNHFYHSFFTNISIETSLQRYSCMTENPRYKVWSQRDHDQAYDSLVPMPFIAHRICHRSCRETSYCDDETIETDCKCLYQKTHHRDTQPDKRDGHRKLFSE